MSLDQAISPLVAIALVELMAATAWVSGSPRSLMQPGIGGCSRALGWSTMWLSPVQPFSFFCSSASSPRLQQGS